MYRQTLFFAVFRNKQYVIQATYYESNLKAEVVLGQHKTVVIG